jgi:hypothetical protein
MNEIEAMEHAWEHHAMSGSSECWCDETAAGGLSERLATHLATKSGEK